MTPVFSSFTLAIKFNCLFLTIFQSFHLFVSFIFDELAPPLNICFKRCFKSLFSPLQCIKTVSKVPKTKCFSHSAFWSTCQWGGGYSPPLPPWLRYWTCECKIWRLRRFFLFQIQHVTFCDSIQSLFAVFVVVKNKKMNELSEKIM